MSKIIAIDPGHSKETKGKRAGDFYEYKSNRNIAKILYKLLLECGFEPVYTVDLDDTRDASLYERAVSAIRQNADALVSLHSNAHSDPNARGTETYIHTNTQASVPFAKDIQMHLVGELKRYDRGVKRANFGVLRHSYKEMLCCLTEGEFFSTPETRKWMLTRDYEVKYAVGVAKGLCEHFNVPFQGADPMDKGYLAEGDIGDSVKELQRLLNKHGFDLKVDGSYGPATEKAVKAFQKAQGLEVDGYYGPNTQKALEKAQTEDKVESQKEESDMEKVAIVINSFADFPSVEQLAKRKDAGIFLRDIAEERQVAEKIIVVGGGTKGLKGKDFTDLSGDNRYETAQKVKEYM